MRLSIEKLVYGGDGLARLPADENGRGKAAFVPFVLEGETVEATLVENKPGFARARLDEVIERSANRIEAPCPYYGRCGGCHYQHTDYRHQLEIKAAVLKENLRRIAKVELETEPIVHASPEWNYRNRARLRVRTQPDFALGYYRFASHELLPVEQCPISSALINRGISVAWELGRAGKIPQEIQEIEFFANAEDDQLLLLLYCAPPLSTEAAQNLAEDLRGTASAIGALVIAIGANESAELKPMASAGEKALNYKTKDAAYRVSGGAFFQVNRFLTDQLVEIVTANRSGNAALDLYAGVGLFSSVLARSFAQVTAVESSPTAYADLSYNSPANVKAVHATTDRFLQQRAGKVRPDLIVLDPPRGGLGGMVVRSLAGLEAAEITYVSCDPATLARDLAGLLAAGYHIRQAHVVDLFPQTYHVESVVRLSR
ncbi:MAG TPA: class I SAM-dependent RNA methyltransferase [Terriglobales bacterium]|nr:class I SAM-dependent RNA methyltransferase [Terriglobales bacterium]